VITNQGRPEGNRAAEENSGAGSGPISVQILSDPGDNRSYGMGLFDQHQVMLAESKITPEHARARGYRSVDTKARLEVLGVTKAGRNVPGLLVPQLRKDGSTWGYQYRPDVPRLNGAGKPNKYETPVNQRNGIDVPPGVGPMLDDPAVPLFVTEGVKKADAAACAGLACVALPGVWSWRGRNEQGGKTAVPDWHDVALNDRRIVLAFDSDVVRKRLVRTALDQLAGYLTGKGAKIEYLHLPDNSDGKTGLDDYLAEHTVDELWALVRPDPPEVVHDRTEGSIPPRNTATPQHPKSETVPALAQLRRILDKVADEVRARGLVGEEQLAQTLYLVLTSRLLDKQVSAGVKGHSASGKSYTVETVTKFFPPEAYLEFTAMSEHALVYSTEQYSHRSLIMYEVVALREGVEDDMTSYFIRSLLSEGRIDYEVTVRGADGGFTTKRIVKEGPTNIIFTTTKTKVHAENETRILSLATDDSREQTARVLLELADEGRSGGDLSEWLDLQRWLAGAEHRVTIPYARALVEKIPPVAVRLRRDVGSLLALIRSHAVLHQATRAKDEHGRIVADLDDYAVVRGLVADVMAEGVGTTVSETVRQTVEAVAAIARPEGVQLRPLADRLRLDKSNVSRRLAKAADDGYLRNLEDKRGKPGRWVVGDPLPEAADLLPDPSQLRNAAQSPDKDRCGVAPISRREAEPIDLPLTVSCEVCGGPLLNPTQQARGTCGPCELRKTA
jgi:pyrimidine operon attenuation protein/uracil phosphoribosyltransferase